MPRCLAALLQLASPTPPVGAFSYSQGLEWAVERGLVHDETSAGSWLGSVLNEGVAAWEAPWIAALMRAWAAGVDADVRSLNERFLASRETRELLAETLQMGRSMLDVLRDPHRCPSKRRALLEDLARGPGLCFPVAWSAAAAQRGVAVGDALVAYLWSWLVNSVMTAIKAVPLGQRAGQRILTHLGGTLGALSEAAACTPPDRCRNFLPGFTLASMHHETQYTRLFRS